MNEFRRRRRRRRLHRSVSPLNKVLLANLHCPHLRHAKPSRGTGGELPGRWRRGAAAGCFLLLLGGRAAVIDRHCLFRGRRHCFLLLRVALLPRACARANREETLALLLCSASLLCPARKRGRKLEREENEKEMNENLRPMFEQKTFTLRTIFY